MVDVACGSGLAIELARLRGPVCSGVDASARLAAVARERNPGCDFRVGDMHALPWAAPEGVTWRLGAGAVAAGGRGQGGQPGGDGVAGSAGCARSGLLRPGL